MIIASTPLSASTIKMRWKEPYVTAALNQKNIASTPKGVLTGFTVVPSGTALHVTLQVDPTLGISAANVLETTGGVYRVSIVQTSSFDIDLTPAAGQTVYVCLDAQYAVGMTSAASVEVVDEAQLSLPAGADLVLLAKVTVPGAGVIPSGNINLGYRMVAGDSETPEMHQHFNLIYNPTFEATNAGWANTGFDSANASTDYARTGGYSLKLVKTVAGLAEVTAGPMPVVPARAYRTSVWLRCPAGLTGGNGGKFQIGFYDAAGAQIGGWTDIESPVTAATTDWVLRKAEVTAPALALTAKARVLFDNCSGTLYVDDAEFSSHMHDEVVKSAVFGGPTVPADAYHTHTAVGLNYAGGVNWADGTTNPATTVEAQLDKILTDLSGAGGAPKIGNCPSKITLNTFTQLNTFNNGIALGATATASWLTTGWNLRANGGQQFFLDNDVFVSGTGMSPFRFLIDSAGDAAHLEFFDGVGARAGVVGLNNGGVAYTAWSGLGVGTTSNHPLSLLTNGTTVWQVANTGELQGVGGNRAIQNVLDPVTAQDAATKQYVDANSGGAINAIINGGFHYWQRGNIHTISILSDSAGYNFHGYTADRWYAQTREDGGGGVPIAVDIRPFTVTGLGDTNRAARIRNQSAGVSAQFYQLVQELDRDTVLRLRGKKVSWRVAVRKGTSSPASTDCFVEVYSNTGAASQRLSAYSGGALVGSNFASGGSLSAVNWTYLTGTSAAVIPATANGMSILLGAYQNGGGPADANDYLEFGEVSVVAAEAAPASFRWAGNDLNTELNICERYYEKSYPISITPGTALATSGFEKFENNNLPAQLLPGVRFKTRKRATPAITFYTPAGGTAGSWDETLSPGAYPITANGIADTGFYATQASIGTGGNWQGHWTADSEI